MYCSKPITVKLPLESTLSFVLSYFKEIELDVFKNGSENIKLFCFVVNSVLALIFKFVICVVWPFIKPNNDDDDEFKFVIWVVWPFIKPNKLVLVAFILDTDVVWPLINPNNDADVVYWYIKIMYWCIIIINSYIIIINRCCIVINRSCMTIYSCS